MHPLNKIFFGSDAGSIIVHFNDGSSVVSGYIVKQPSATTWVVTADGTTTYTCKLSPTTSPSFGYMTIYAYPITSGVASITPEHVIRIDGHHIKTLENNYYIWTVSPSLPSTTGYAVLEHY